MTHAACESGSRLQCAQQMPLQHHSSSHMAEKSQNLVELLSRLGTGELDEVDDGG